MVCIGLMGLEGVWMFGWMGFWGVMLSICLGVYQWEILDMFTGLGFLFGYGWIYHTSWGPLSQFIAENRGCN